MSKMTYKLSHPLARKNACQGVMGAPDGYVVIIQEATRSVEQNSAQWPYLEGFSQQLLWPVNGEMCRLTPEEYKDILTAAFEKETKPRLAMGFDGGVVMLGQRTSKFGRRRFHEWMEFLKYAAAERGVTPVYKNPPRDAGYEQYPEAM